MLDEQRPQPEQYEVHPALQRFADGIESVALFIGRHWAALFNLILFIYVGLALLAPALMARGATLPAMVIYALYSPACHQLPERSYFLFGQSPVYDLEQLRGDGVELSDNLLLRRRYIGDSEHGWKVAICQRDVAIYGSMLAAGLLFALANFRFPHLSWKLYLLFLIPMALDGGSQLVGLRSATWWTRTFTGVLFGVATIWLLYPYLGDSMKGVGRKEGG